MSVKAGIRYSLSLLFLLASTSCAHATYSYNDVASTLQTLESRPATQGAEVRVVSIGKTVNGRDIFMAELGAPAELQDATLPSTAQSEPAATQPSVKTDGQSLVLTLEPSSDSIAEDAPMSPASAAPEKESSSKEKTAEAAAQSEDNPAASEKEPDTKANADGMPVLPAIDTTASENQHRNILIICRQHGNEPASTEAAMRFLKNYTSTEDPAKLAILRRVTFYVIPMLNADGAEKDKRSNGHGVDLNRDWLAQTQPETQAVVRTVRELHPDLVLDAHELYYTDRTPTFVEEMEPEAGTTAVIGDANNAATAAVVGPLREQSLNIYARPVHNYREPRLAHRYFAIKLDVPTILVETNRVNNTPLEKRVAIHYAAFEALGRYLSGEEISTPSRVLASWLIPGASKSYKALVAKRSQPNALAQALAARSKMQLASRGGNAAATAKKRAELLKKRKASKSKQIKK